LPAAQQILHWLQQEVVTTKDFSGRSIMESGLLSLKVYFFSSDERQILVVSLARDGRNISSRD
jgi:hypothetical protein